MAPDRTGEPDRQEPPPEGTGRAAQLFSEDALRHHLSESEEGDVLRLSPSWTRWTYRLLLAVVVSLALYLTLASAPTYETGPAILRIEGRISLPSEATGTIESVEVRPGQRVSEGDVLLHFRATRERAARARFEQEFELQLIQRLLDPGDERAGAELRRLRGELEVITAQLEQRLIRAPREGVVSDVRIHDGQPVVAGDEVLALVPPESEYTVVILFPGQARPRLAPEMPVRLEIEGYPYAYVSTSIETVGDQVISPSEALRYLGPTGDGIDLRGPVVLVEGRLSSDTFRSRGQEYSLHDGMRAEAKVPVRTERVLFRLIPGLKALGSGRNG